MKNVLIDNKKFSSNKSFGIVFSIFFLIIFFYQFLFKQNFNIYYLTISLIFLLLAFFYSKILSIPNFIWTKIGLLLGVIVSPIVMYLIYFLVLFPISILLKLFNKDLLKLKISKNIDSYWIVRDKNNINLNDQF